MTYSEFVKKVTDCAMPRGDWAIVDVLPRVVLSTVVSTAATNATNIFFNPDFADSLTPEELVGVLAHELFHEIERHTVIRWKIYDVNSHIPRSTWFELANVAEDIIINEWLIRAGYQLPADGCRRSDIPDLPAHCISSHEIFNFLIQKFKDSRAEAERVFKDLLNAIQQAMQDDEAVGDLPPVPPTPMPATNGDAKNVGDSDDDDDDSDAIDTTTSTPSDSASNTASSPSKSAESEMPSEEIQKIQQRIDEILARQKELVARRNELLNQAT